MMTKSEKFNLNVFNGLLFLAFPFLAIPGILQSLYKNTRGSVIFYSLIISFISFLFKPTLEMDKSRHIYFYDICKNLSFDGFLVLNFQDSPDFIFRLILYIGAVNNISFHLLSFLVTFVTVYLILKVYRLYVDDLGIKNNILVTLLVITSVSYIDILSGMRYTLAISFIFYGYYLGIFLKKKISIVWFLLGVFTHFGTILFVVIYFTYPFISKIKYSNLKLLLIFSLLFLIIPQELIFNFFKMIGFGGAFETKVDAYLDADDMTGDVKSFSEKFILFFITIWIYVLNFYFLAKTRKLSDLSTLLIVLLIATNIFISFPIIYNRYALFTKLILVLFLLKEQIIFNKVVLTKTFLVIFLITCLNQVIVLRPSLIEMFYPSVQNWSFIYQMSENDFTLKDLK